MDEQHERHRVGSLSALLSQAPFRMSGRPKASNFAAPQIVETGAIVREMVLAQQDVGSKPVHISRSTRRTDSYDTRVPMRGVSERFNLLDRLEHGSPFRGGDLEAEARGQLEGGQAEIRAADGQGQR